MSAYKQKNSWFGLKWIINFHSFFLTHPFFLNLVLLFFSILSNHLHSKFIKEHKRFPRFKIQSERWKLNLKISIIFLLITNNVLQNNISFIYIFTLIGIIYLKIQYRIVLLAKFMVSEIFYISMKYNKIWLWN